MMKYLIVILLFQYLLIILIKRRMMESIEKNRLITKLIKIISQKEKIIEKYKRNQRNINKQMKVQADCCNAIDQKIQQDINSTHIEVKSIQQKVKQMDGRIQQLTSLLNQEVTINTNYQAKIRYYQSKENQYCTQMQQLKTKLKYQQEKNVKLTQQVSILQIENAKLSQKIKEFSIQLQYQAILQNKIETLAKSLLDYEKFQQKIGENIDSIYFKFCHTLMKSSRQIKPKQISLRTEDLTNKLEQIQQSLKETLNFYEGDVLNETIDGFSIIMKSFEDKLEDVVCFTERRNYQENSQCKHTNARTKLSNKEEDQSLRLLQSNKENKRNMNGSI